MRYLHTMVRISNIEQSLDFYCNKLGLEEVRRVENEAGRYTLIFLAAPGDKERAASERAPLLELTYNWDPEEYGSGRNFGHLAYEVDDIYETCERLMKAGVTINRPPRDGRMAFIRSPDNISIELLQKGEQALEPDDGPALGYAFLDGAGEAVGVQHGARPQPDPQTGARQIDGEVLGGGAHRAGGSGHVTDQHPEQGVCRDGVGCSIRDRSMTLSEHRVT